MVEDLLLSEPFFLPFLSLLHYLRTDTFQSIYAFPLNRQALTFFFFTHSWQSKAVATLVANCEHRAIGVSVREQATHGSTYYIPLFVPSCRSWTQLSQTPSSQRLSPSPLPAYSGGGEDKDTWVPSWSEYTTALLP